MTVTDGTTIAEIDRDSLVYDQVVEKVSDGLGSNPVGLFLNAGYLGPYGEVFETSDEVGVMQDRWVELNGSTLERSVYTEDEFRGDLPEAGLHPQAAAMTFSAKALLNSDGYIYWAGTAFASDFHSCAYTSFPLGKDKKFKEFIQALSSISIMELFRLIQRIMKLWGSLMMRKLFLMLNLV